MGKRVKKLIKIKKPKEGKFYEENLKFEIGRASCRERV